MSFDDPTEAAQESEDTADVGKLRPGDLVDGRYALRRLLGFGGMGEVWEAEHIALGRSMALKVLHQRRLPSEQQRSRFLREARVVSRIEHPNIIEVSDFGALPEGQPFLAMKLLEGRTLRAVLRDDGPLPWPRALAILRQIAAGLAEAHRQGVVHRDLKPENIFVGPGPLEHVTVFDFGIARKTDYDPKTAKLTATGTVFGTPGYMAPEQIRGMIADAHADIYAWGCVAYELLTGRRVFEGGVFERLEGHLYRRPTALPESVPSSLARLVERCLEKASDERLPSMDAVLSGLDQVGQTQRRTALVDSHIPAAPPGAPTQAGRATMPGIPSATFVSTQPDVTVAVSEPAPTPARPRGRWMVAGVTVVVGLTVLGISLAAWRRPEPAPLPAPGVIEEPTPHAPATVAQPSALPEVEVVIAKPKVVPDVGSETPEPTETPPARSATRRKKKPTTKPDRRPDGTFELFPDE